MEKKNEKLDATVSNAPAQTDNLSNAGQDEMRKLSQEGKLKELDDQGAPIPGNFASSESLIGQGIEIQKIQHHDLTHATNTEKVAQTTAKDTVHEQEHRNKELQDRARQEKHADGSIADIDKDGHLIKLIYPTGQGYNYEWHQGKLVSIDSFDKNGNVKPWLEKNNDGTWTQFDEKQDQIWNADLTVNQNGDMQWTHRQSEFHKEGDVEINRVDGSHTDISKANHTWKTTYPDGQERKLVYDEKTNNPCEYWAPKPHSSHWKSSDGLTWHQVGADGKPLNKPPMIGKFITDDETGSFSFLNLGEKGNPHITAYDGTGQPTKPSGRDTAVAMVAAMVEQYAIKKTSGGKTAPQEEFERDSRNASLNIDDRIAAKILTKLVQDFQASHIKQSSSSPIEVVTAFLDMATKAETGDSTANEHIYEAMRDLKEEKEKKPEESSETT